MYFFTGDEHNGHRNIIRFCNRPFKDIFEMDQEITKRFNEVVGPKDICIHAGDYAFRNKLSVNNYIDRLNGTNIFLKGSHDKWNKNGSYIWEGMIEDKYVVVCHYPLRSWRRSHYGSINLHGHSHGNIEPFKNQLDIGVDCNNFYPFSFKQVIEQIEKQNMLIDDKRNIS
jgi:calcineurin-like phosphoesterase family protein